MMEESAAVKKLVHRKIKDCTITSEFRNFFLTLLCIVAFIYFFSSRPSYYTEYEKREKIDIKKLYTALLHAVELGGKEVIKENFAWSLFAIILFTLSFLISIPL